MSDEAFIFDLDGVLIDSEALWQMLDERLLVQFAGQEIARDIGSSIGLSVGQLYQEIIARGVPVSFANLKSAYDALAPEVYASSRIADGIPELLDTLKEHGYAIGIVSSSPGAWVSLVMDRMPFAAQFEYVLPLGDHADIPAKPKPDGYLKACVALGASPEKSVALEDSNPGIESAKRAGLFTIAYTGFLTPDYVQTGAAARASTMKEVREIIARRTGDGAVAF